MKKRLIVIAVLGLLCGLVVLEQSRGQAPPSSEPSFLTPVTKYVRDRYGYGAAPSAAQAEIAKLMGQLREAEDDAKKAELNKQLQTAVAKYFDEDLKNRESELTKLDERLKKLRAQLERRRKARAEIIELQIKVLGNEAEGLGFQGASFFDPTASQPPMIFRSLGVVPPGKTVPRVP